MKDVRLLLPLVKVMKIVRLTSFPLDMLRVSTPRPRLRHGRRLARLSLSLSLSLSLFPKSDLKKVYFLIRSVAGSSSSSSSPNFPNCSSPMDLASVYYLRSHFSVSEPKALRSRIRGYFSDLIRATYRRSLVSLSALPSCYVN